MRASIRDKKALIEISPGALSAYARVAGWNKTDIYGDHSDVYTSEGLPEIILPRSQRLGDYASIVSRLIEIFAKVAELDELTLYRDLVTADRDVIRLRTAESNDGSVAASDGINIIRGAHDMLLAAACSLQNSQPLYRAGANKEASDYLNRVRLGQTEQGSFVITLLTPVVPPPIQQPLFPESAPDDDPVERQITKRLAGALAATRQATEKTVGGNAEAFSEAVKYGVSANLCEALVEVISPFETLDISLTWARTRPIDRVRDVIGFATTDAPILREAARSFRERESHPDVSLFGVVRILKRDKAETDGTVTLLTSIEGQNQSVKAVLKQSDYERAVSAHKEKAPVVMKGDLERLGQRWRLLNPSIADVIREDAPNESE